MRKHWFAILIGAILFVGVVLPTIGGCMTAAVYLASQRLQPDYENWPIAPEYYNTPTPKPLDVEQVFRDSFGPPPTTTPQPLNVWDELMKYGGFGPEPTATP